MAWSYARARQAASMLRAAPFGPRAVATARPRSALGLVRTRAPLPLLLFVAAGDELVVEQDNGGFAVLQRATYSRAVRSGGYKRRLLRWIDRRWDMLMFSGPPALGLLAALATVPFAPTRPIALVLAIGCVLWVCAFLLSMLVWQLPSLAGAQAVIRRSAVDSLAAYRWHVLLVHQVDRAYVDDMIRLLTERLARLVHADLQLAAATSARIRQLDITEPLVVLADGISTAQARTAMAESVRAERHSRAEHDAIVFTPPSRPDAVPARRLAGGGFLLLYMSALALIIAVAAWLVAGDERRSCAPTSCQGRPATYVTALRFLTQRLLLSDPRGLSPGMASTVAIGWLVSVAAVVLVLVAFAAARQEIARNRQRNEEFDEVLADQTRAARVLVLVATQGERDAVLAAVRARVRRAPGIDQAGERTMYTLGTIAGTQILLAQAAEQGTSAAAGMLVTAREAIGQSQPDYVILVGICFGLRPDVGQQIGDIVVARRMQNIDHRKVTDDDELPVISRGVNVGCSPLLLDRFQAAQLTWSGQRVHIGTVLTSNTVVNSQDFVNRLRRDFPDAIAGEMECSGVYEAAMSDERRPDWIMVKAICDWGYHKTDDAQQIAARNAAEFVTSTIAGGGLRRHAR